MLSQALKQLMAGDLPTVKSMLRAYINATISFDQLARMLKHPSKSVRRTLSARGKPTVETLFNLIKVLRWHERAQRHLESVLAAVLRRRQEAARG
jgi:DNA-binding phage protein